MKSGIIQQLDDPTTIYNRPRNLFVAGFIGSPSMNFLHGELVKSGDGIAFLANGVIFSLAAYDASETLQPGRKVVLGVRPEHIKVNENTGGEEHDATVDIEEPMGADNLLWLKHAGHTMSVRVNGARRFNVGAKVKLSFDMTVASVFDAESELRL
jgi:multiple sugar transport system ATP-binding protein